jgi:protein brassinosteroid insensitive 2
MEFRPPLKRARAKPRVQVKDQSKGQPAQPAIQRPSQRPLPKEESRMHLREEYAMYNYDVGEVKDKGTFGVIYEARVRETGERVAIKKVFQDRSFKNRELEILAELDHPNVIFMRHSFKENSNSRDKYLHIVMELLPQSLLGVIKSYREQGMTMPLADLREYLFQILRGLAYIHERGICHRDIKPHNILVDPSAQRALLCDFGSAKRLSPD